MLVGFRMARYPPGHSRFRASSFFLSSILRWIRSHKAKTVVAIVQQAARYITISMVVAPCLSKGASPAGTAEHCQSVLYQTYVRIKALQVPYRKTPARHPFLSADSDVKPTQIFTSVLRRFFQTISNVKRRRYKDRQSAALDRAVLWNRSPKRKRELESPIYFAFSNFLRFCETKAVVYFAFSFFVAMRGIETTAILTNRSTRAHRESKRNRQLGNRRSELP